MHNYAAIALLLIASQDVFAGDDMCLALMNFVVELSTSRDSGVNSSEAVEKIVSTINSEHQDRARRDITGLAAFSYNRPDFTSDTLIPYFYGVCKMGGLSGRSEKLGEVRETLEKEVLQCQKNNPASPPMNDALTSCVYGVVREQMQ